jgi:hypothetical protein
VDTMSGRWQLCADEAATTLVHLYSLVNTLHCIEIPLTRKKDEGFSIFLRVAAERAFCVSASALEFHLLVFGRECPAEECFCARRFAMRLIPRPLLLSRRQSQRLCSH